MQCRVTMADLQQLQVQKAVDSAVKSLERENIQKMLMFWYSCCEDSREATRQVHQCIECCHAPLAQTQLKKFQGCLAQCTMHCSDKAKDSIDAGNRGFQVKWQLETCVTKYVDDHMHLIPTMTEKISYPLGN
ncbi:protein FAM136A-like [Panthera pardus]|uniref:Protein FAM136A n=1 Tax=Panthera pardus TaxID=9691 RepID=A0A9W2W4N3_PANPR|nr:protein FAM136A-like [Panthera pardus]